MRVLRLPGPVRPFILILLAVLGVAAIALVAASVTSGDPPTAFAVFYAGAWGWNAYCWAWATPVTIGIDDSGDLELISAAGRRRHIATDAIESLQMSMLMVPVLRHSDGRVPLLPVAPIRELTEYLKAQPGVTVRVPERAMRNGRWPWGA